MQMLGIGSFEEYTRLPRSPPAEFAQLFNTILINVTSFFRDPEAWEYLAREVVPRDARAQAGRQPGARLVGGLRLRRGGLHHRHACSPRRWAGRRSASASRSTPPTSTRRRSPRRARRATRRRKSRCSRPSGCERYFDLVNGRYVFRSDLRRAVIFGRHDLMQDAPISRLDLLVCRNTLMYFNAEAQARILGRFHFALNGDGKGNGMLFLGRAEMLLTHGRAVHAARAQAPRVRQGAAARSRARALPLPAAAIMATEATWTKTRDCATWRSRNRPVPRIVVDANGVLALANARARVLFSINAKDLGRPLQDLEISYRPVELRALIEQAHAERRTVTLTSVERRFPDGEVQYLDVVVAPLFEDGQKPLGAAVTFIDVTRATRLQDELRALAGGSADRQRGAAVLQRGARDHQRGAAVVERGARDHQRGAAVDQRRAGDHERGAAVDQRGAADGERGAAHAQRGAEPRSTRSSSRCSASLRAGAVVVNSNLDVLMWNHRAEDLWGLRADEVQGKGLLNLDIGLPVAELRTVIRPCLAGESRPPGGGARRGQPPRQEDPMPRHLHAAGRRQQEARRRDPDDGRDLKSGRSPESIGDAVRLRVRGLRIARVRDGQEGHRGSRRLCRRHGGAAEAGVAPAAGPARGAVRRLAPLARERRASCRRSSPRPGR